MMSDVKEYLIAKYDRPVPRYTSFPTAVQFRPHCDQNLYKVCANQIPVDQPISLYVHIPFCHSLCHYCGCHTKIVHSYTPIEQYTKSLLKEIQHTGALMKSSIPVSRIHFGGGSPNYMKTKNLKEIIALFDKIFDLSSTQIDMECDPRLLDYDKILTMMCKKPLTEFNLFHL